MTSTVLIKPHFTEKSMAKAQSNSYTFEVSLNATKSLIIAAVTSAFKVNVTKVNLTYRHIPSKYNNTRRTLLSAKKAKYATVTLKKGQTLDLFEFKDK